MRACVLFILFTCWLFGQSVDPPEVTRVHVKEEILAADAEFRTTVLHGDATKLATIFADDIIIVHSDGEKDTKKNFLDAIASGRLKMISYERNDIQIRVYGVVAVMFSKASKTFLYKGSPAKAADTSIVTFAKLGDHWRIVAMQNTPRSE